MKTIIATGKNVEKAIENGLLECGLTQEEVDIKIIDEGGFFRKAKVELSFEEKVAKETVKEEKKPAKNKETTKKEPKKEEKTEKPAKVEEKETKPAKTEENQEEAVKVGKKFLEEFLVKFGVEAEVNVVKAENGTTFAIKGEKVNELIGRRGETLNAVQEVLNLVLKNNGFKQTHMFIDVEDYKTRREESLISLANRMAHKAVKINKPIKLEAMSAYERKIIHTALQADELVTTKSEGEEPNRYLVILPVKKEK